VIQSKPAKPAVKPHWSNAGKPAHPQGMVWAKRKGKVVLVPIKSQVSSAKQKKLKPISNFPAKARKDIAKIRKQLFSTSSKSNVNKEIEFSNLSEAQKFAIAGRFDNTAAFGDQTFTNKAMDFYRANYEDVD
jgi:microsomal dipeptidase-like Zn-dependent dipeptidase